MIDRFLFVCVIIFVLQFLFGIVAFGDDDEDPSEYLQRQDKFFRYSIYFYVILCVIGFLRILYWIGVFIVKG